MKTRAAVLRGKKDIFIREFELPEITEDELLVEVVTNSICLSTYKAALLGEEHKRVPKDISTKPIITGHEFAGYIRQVGGNLKDKFKEGEKFVLQPAMGLDTGYSSGYSYEFFGGNATYTIIPKIAIEKDCVLPYKGDFFADASLAEPMCCIIGAYNSSYHTTPYVYEHQMGTKPGGKLALLGCAGPMGIGAIDYAVNVLKPKLVVVTDINEERLKRTQSLIPESVALKNGVELIYLNTSNIDAVEKLMELSNGTGYDDVCVYASVEQLLIQGDEILGNDGCLNFFAGPTDKNFKVPFNFYHVHYSSTHIVGSSGGSTGDMIESLELSEKNIINPCYMVTHIGGLKAAPETILNLPNIPGGKKLIYPHIELDLVGIEEFAELGQKDNRFKKLDEIVKQNNYVWNLEAENYLLENF
ncbi:zinc-binding dehydrogenase [uncultured Ilyobacter sp.]|uniref:zinc-binding dehydrogenase n=1 Tax=uncultured Ilyobacter sp. TaxID=544433 RepID=UPI0029C98229|nr:zinc-binding dehydrogenase [uncultured Ilyobacter sp.]